MVMYGGARLIIIINGLHDGLYVRPIATVSPSTTVTSIPVNFESTSAYSVVGEENVSLAAMALSNHDQTAYGYSIALHYLTVPFLKLWNYGTADYPVYVTQGAYTVSKSDDIIDGMWVDNDANNIRDFGSQFDFLMEILTGG